MLPFVAVGGFLIVRKIRRWDLVLSFLIAALATVALEKLGQVGDEHEFNVLPQL